MAAESWGEYQVDPETPLEYYAVDPPVEYDEA
jgi:hypothetical protein